MDATRTREKRRVQTEAHLKATLVKRAKRLLRMIEHNVPDVIVSREALLIYEAGAALSPNAVATVLAQRSWMALSLCGSCGLVPVERLDVHTGLCEDCTEQADNDILAAQELDPDDVV